MHGIKKEPIPAVYNSECSYYGTGTEGKVSGLGTMTPGDKVDWGKQAQLTDNPKHMNK